MRQAFQVAAVATLALCCLAGCAGRPEREVPNAPNLLPFLKDGSTTKEDVLLKLGEPSGRFESERILTYRMADGENGGLAVTSPRGIGGWETARYSLVLVFDDRQILTTHSLVRVR
jgi:hypothetical protein